MVMKATQILVKEHKLIRQLLHLFARAREQLENGGHPPLEFIEESIALAREYADKFHHFKEKYLMFGLLAQKKEGRLDAEIGALRFQHDRGRGCLEEIEKNLAGYSRKDQMAATMVLEHMAAYISLLRRHIYQEDHIFFPMAEKLLSREEYDYLLREFEKQEEHQGGAGYSQAIRDRLTRLAELIDAGTEESAGS